MRLCTSYMKTLIVKISSFLASKQLSERVQFLDGSSPISPSLVNDTKRFVWKDLEFGLECLTLGL